MHTITEDDAGYGHIKYENGLEYEGRIYGAIPHGEGTLRDSDGSVYEGIFFHGSPQGEGMWTTPDGKTAFGCWKHGKFQVIHSNEPSNDNEILN
jgi:1-phosphatidylinositol-4-phosphate 5-kinase